MRLGRSQFVALALFVVLSAWFHPQLNGYLSDSENNPHASSSESDALVKSDAENDAGASLGTQANQAHTSSSESDALAKSDAENDAGASLGTQANQAFVDKQREKEERLRRLYLPPILYQHFHKSGGTDACNQMSFFSTIRPTAANASTGPWPRNTNCNALGYGPYIDPRMQNEEEKLTCARLTPYTTNLTTGVPFQRNNFIAVEIGIDEAFPCPGFRNVALMRNPVTRLLSHMRAHYFSEKFMLGGLREHRRRWNMSITSAALLGEPSRDEIKGQKFVQKESQESPFVRRIFPMTNNLVIRHLLGLSRIHHDRRPINDDDLAKAKAAVDQFSVFVPLEKQKEPQVKALLERVVPEFQEAALPYEVMKKKRAAERGNVPQPYAPSDQFLELVRDENKYDILLYEYVHQKLGLSLAS